MVAKQSRMSWGAAALLVIAAMTAGVVGASEKVPRMTVEQLKDLIGKPEVVILDVRSKSDWEKGRAKIQDAVREDPSKPAKTWAGKYGKDKTLVLYCA